MNDVSRVQIYNSLVQSGFAQIGTRVALDLPDDNLAAAKAECQRRRDETLQQLDGRPSRGPPGESVVAPPRRRGLGLDCIAGAVRLPIVTTASYSAMSPLTGWRYSVTGSAAHW